MSPVQPNQGITFVYDGDCPLCSKAATALRIKKDYGQLTLLNAREATPHPLITQINERGFDLDEGMVIYDSDRFYHGEEALVFMARYSDHKGAYNLITKLLFQSRLLAKLCYPWMRSVRNALLKRKHISRIDNLGLTNEPIFKSVFGESWHALPPVLRKRYSIRPYTDDRLVVNGLLDISSSGPVKWFAPVFMLLATIPPRNENAVPVTVTMASKRDSQVFGFDRMFYFKDRKPHQFRSQMVKLQGDQVIEFMRFGIGWKMQCVWEDDRVKLKHAGYVLRVLGHILPFPAQLLLGKGYGEEVAVNDYTYDMQVQMDHPLWGRFYEYKGRITMQDPP